MMFTIVKCFHVRVLLCVFLLHVCFLAHIPRGFATPLLDDNNSKKKHQHYHPPANQRALSLRAGSSSSSSSYSLGLQSNNNRNNNKQAILSSKNKDQSSTLTTTNQKSPIGIAAISSLSTGGRKRRACQLYVWDFPSALFYHWCHHLLKDSVYEGRGGRKFVRIEPGSMLQLLYPCSRYSPDRCILCGGSFRDHLELWWSKNLYNPFDLLVEKVLQQGVHVQKEQVIKSKKRKGAVVVVVSKPEEVDYVYHRRYVLDLDQTLRGTDKPKERQKILKKISVENAALAGQVERRKVQLGREKVNYVVPASTSSTTPKPSTTFILLRAILLRALDNLIEVELFEKQKHEASR